MSTEYTNYLRTLALHDGEVGRRAQAELMKTVDLDEVVDPVDGETLRDVLRHDKGHDDWHAAHGDPPCKDEADCAQMRAKYDDDDNAGVTKAKDDAKNVKKNKNAKTIVKELKRMKKADPSRATTIDSLISKLAKK